MKAFNRLSMNSLGALQLADLLPALTARCDFQLQKLNILSADKMANNRQVKILRHLYSDTISSLATLESYQAGHLTASTISRHTKSTLESIESRHSMVAESLADIYKVIPKSTAQIEAIRKMLRLQTSISACIQHSIALATGVACIENVDVLSLCSDARLQARALAEHSYNFSPDISIFKAEKVQHGIYVRTIPSYVVFVLVEVFKNSLRATVEQYCQDNRLNPSDILEKAMDTDMPISLPIVKTCVEESEKHVIVTITDNGIGMNPEAVDNCATFMWGPSMRLAEMVVLNASYQPMSPPLHGLGVGLCLSKLYATHFGGDLVVRSEGCGRGTVVEFYIAKDGSIEECI